MIEKRDLRTVLAEAGNIQGIELALKRGSYLVPAKRKDRGSRWEGQKNQDVV